MEMLRPSTPMVVADVESGNPSDNLRQTEILLWLRSKLLNSQIAINSGGTVAAAETQRISLALFGSASTIAAPATGIKVM